MIVRLPGVYPPQHDTSLLSDVLVAQSLTARSRVLDLCTGTGVLSVAATKAGAGHVVAVDIARRACLNARLNAVVAGKRIEVRRGDLTEAVQGELFDVVVSNPPYVPALGDELPTSGIERAWDAGKDGRALLDRIALSCAEVLAPGGGVAVAAVSAVWCAEDGDNLGRMRIDGDCGCQEFRPFRSCHACAPSGSRAAGFDRGWTGY